MRRSMTATLLLSATLALAASPHLKPPHRTVTFSDGGLTLSAAGELAGLGNGDVLVAMNALADVTATCANPAGHEAPGQNTEPVTVTGAQTIPQEDIRNGNVPFSVVTLPPVTPVPGAPGCPNSQWFETRTDLAFLSAILTVEQPAGVVVLTVSCTLAPPTTDGPVSPLAVACEVAP